MIQKMSLATRSEGLRQFFKTNAAPASYATLVAIAAGRVMNVITDGVLPVATDGASNTSYTTLFPVGVGSEGDTYNTQIIGYRTTSYNGASNDEAVPFVLADVQITLGSVFSVIHPTWRFAKLITVNLDGSSNPIIVKGYEIPPVPSNCPIMRLKLDLEGAQYVRMLPGTATGATSMNMLEGGF